MKAHTARLALWPLALAALAAHATPPTENAGAPGTAWQGCAALQADRQARLDCFDRWAAGQAQTAVPAVTTAAPAPAAATALPATLLVSVPGSAAPQVASSNNASDDGNGCNDRRYSFSSRFWELEDSASCGTFVIRGYRPISLSVVKGSHVNSQPNSPAPGHMAPAPIDYRSTETRIQLSVRTKIAQGLLTQNEPSKRDSLWFGYTQQSYWQLFSSGLSRPFRATDHEPELIYIYPTEMQLPHNWRWRFGGVGLVHQSNGQSLPLSRSWNRVYLMAGLEHGPDLRLTARIWRRLPENAANDDNPDISSYIGRAELQGSWDIDQNNTVSATLRSALKSDSRGSLRLEWLRTLHSSTSGPHAGLRFHTQLFSGYGDSLIDYNRRRTVFSMGLSLLDF